MRNRRPHIPLVLAALFLLFAAHLFAAVEQRRPITLDVTDFELGKLASNFAQMAEAELDAPQELLEAKVTLRVERVRWQTALDALCDTAGCKWSVVGPRFERRMVLTRSEKPEPAAADAELNQRLHSALSFSLQQAEARDVLAGLARAGGLEAMIDEEIAGPVTMAINGVRLRTALDIMCQSLGCDWLIDGESLVVSPLETVDAELPASLGEEITMSLKDADACEVLATIARITQFQLERPEHLCAAPVTVEATRLPASRLLDHLTEQWQAQWRIDGDRLVVEKAPPPSDPLARSVDIDLDDAPACEVLQALARMIDAEAPVCNDFLQPKRVVLSARAVPASELLDRLCDEWRCSWTVDGGGLELTPLD